MIRMLSYFKSHHVKMFHLRELINIQRRQLSQHYLFLHLKKGSTLRGNNLLPFEVNYLLLKYPFSGEAKCKGKLNLSLLKDRWITKKKKNKKQKTLHNKDEPQPRNHLGTVSGTDWLSWGLTTRQPLCVISFLRCLPEKMETRDSRGNEREGQGRKNSRIESEETEEIKTFPLYPYLLQG